MKKSSTWTALQNPVFRKLWFASLISVMSAVASLPFFLFTLPAVGPASSTR